MSLGWVGLGWMGLDCGGVRFCFTCFSYRVFCTRTRVTPKLTDKKETPDACAGFARTSDPSGATVKEKFPKRYPSIVALTPFTTGNPFLATKLLGTSIGRGSGALKGVTLALYLVFLRLGWLGSAGLGGL